MTNRRSALVSLVMVLVGAIFLALPGKAIAAPGGPGKVAVSVVDGDGKPVAGALVELRRSRHLISHGRTNAEGVYVFERVRPGRFGVDAAKREVGRGRAAAEVKSGETTRVEITLKKPK